MRCPAYPEYGEAEADWFGVVPRHWDVRRLKFIARIGNGSTPSRDDSAYWDAGTYPWLNSSVVNQETVTSADQFVTPLALAECHLPQIQPPAVLVGITGEGRTRGMASTLLFAATINQHLAYVKPDASQAVVGFLRRVFDSAYSYLRNESDGGGSTKGAITCEQIAEMAVPVPPVDEQNAIAAFLDWKTGQIDALIGKKKELLEKLKEKRIAVITQAVTQGLNPAAPMRDSGIPWLGQVPEHWEVPALKFRYTVELGKMLDEKRLTGEHSIHYLRNVDVQWDQINYENLPVMDIPPEEYSRYTIRAGDVLACEGGEVGRSAVVREQSGIIGFQKAIHRLRTDSDDELPTFVYYTLLWAVHTKVFSAEGSSTIAHLTADQLRRYRFPRPPRCEQEIIVAYLEGQVGRMNKLAAKIESAIDFLTEYRTALITAATTGKIDLRQVKIPACA